MYINVLRLKYHPLDHRTGVANITQPSRGIIANHHSLETNYLLQGDSIQYPFHGIVTTSYHRMSNSPKRQMFALDIYYIYYPVDPTTNINNFPNLSIKVINW